jgi:hypothetical protein
MPTKTKSNKSISPARAIPPQAIMALAKGGIGGLTSGLSNVGTEFGQIRDDFKEQDFRSQKFGKKLGMLAKAGGRMFATGQQAVLSGVSTGLLGTDFGLGSKGFLADNNPQAAMPGQAPGQETAPVENIAQNSSAGGNPVFNPANENTINSVMGPTDTYGSLFT